MATASKTSTKGASKKDAKEKPVIAQGAKTKTPKQLAQQWKIDPKKLRRAARALWGTHFERWEFDATMEKALKKELKIK